MRLELFAFGVVLAAAVYLIVLGVGALIRPDRTKAFLGGFAQTLRVHAVELVVRVVLGAAVVIRAPKMQFGAVLELVGWVLIGTTLILALIPWRLHRRFAEWSVPQATRHMPLLGLGSLVAGLALLGALVLPRAAG